MYNAFPNATATVLEAAKAHLESILTGNFEPGATNLRNQKEGQLRAEIRQLEQQMGQSGPNSSPLVQPMIRRNRTDSPATVIAGVQIPLAATGDTPLDYSTIDIPAMDYEQMSKVAEKAGLLGFPDDETERREFLKKATEEGLFAPEVVSLRLKRNQLLDALGKAEPAEIKDSYSEDVIRLAGGYLLGHAVTSVEPKTVGVTFIKQLKEAKAKKAELDRAKSEAKAGGEGE